MLDYNEHNFVEDYDENKYMDEHNYILFVM